MALVLRLHLTASFIAAVAALGKPRIVDVDHAGGIKEHDAHKASSSSLANSSYSSFSVDAVGAIELSPAELSARLSCVGTIPGCDRSACMRSKDCCNHNQDFENMVKAVRNEYNSAKQNGQTKEQGGWYDCKGVLEMRYASSNLKRACMDNPCMPCIACQSGDVNFCTAFYNKYCHGGGGGGGGAPPPPSGGGGGGGRGGKGSMTRTRTRRGGKGLLMEFRARAKQKTHTQGKQDVEASLMRRSIRDHTEATKPNENAGSLEESFSSKDC